MNTQVDLVPLFTRQFELCRVTSSELVALLSDTRTRPEYLAAAGAAAATLGAQVVHVCVPSMGAESAAISRGMGSGVPALAKDSELRSTVAAALSRATFVVDLVSETIIHLPLREELRRAGCRILTIVEPPDALERMFPSVETRRFAEDVGRRIGATETLRVSSQGGTDLTYRLDRSTPLVQYGYVDEPGRWDHWPSAMATAYPVDETAEGVVVLSPGDVIFPFKRYVETSVRFEISGGYVRSIEGGGDARLVDDYLKSWDEPEVYAVSHIGLGLHHRAQWNALDFYERGAVLGMDARSFLGGFIFSTGPNRHVGRDVDAHLDIPMRGCTIELDGEPLVLAGPDAAPSSDGHVGSVIAGAPPSTA